MELDTYAAMSFEEIAERMGTTEMAVRQTYRRAMTKIRSNPVAVYELKRACAMARGEYR
jgi:DNA-directed RNA polymerase sigma subunit (sigma70/sigma32)